MCCVERVSVLRAGGTAVSWCCVTTVPVYRWSCRPCLRHHQLFASDATFPRKAARLVPKSATKHRTWVIFAVPPVFPSGLTLQLGLYLWPQPLSSERCKFSSPHFCCNLPEHFLVLRNPLQRVLAVTSNHRNVPTVISHSVILWNRRNNRTEAIKSRQKICRRL